MTRKHKADTIDWSNVWNFKIFAYCNKTKLSRFGHEGFADSQQFMDGGITGISLYYYTKYLVSISVF
jgi:hypothetical protein